MAKIDITKPAKTRSGLEVRGLVRVPHNSVGALVTYPIKGSVVVRKKPLKLEYCIWSDEGIYDVVWGHRSILDLVQE